MGAPSRPALVVAATTSALGLAVMSCTGESAAGPASLAVYPSDITLSVRQPRQIVPAVRTVAGDVLSGRSVHWTSSDSSVATVDRHGLVAAVAPGEVTIVATLDTLRAEVGVTIPRYDHASGDAQSMKEMPRFPGPAPPQWTARFLVPEGLVALEHPHPLGDGFDRITAALRRAGVYEWATYAFEDSGFAVAARLEHIDDDGFPRGARWSVPAGRDGPFALEGYFRRLFLAEPGRYRVIVFVVTPIPLVADTTARPTRAEARRWLQSGAAALPGELRRLVVPDARAHALIYEFYRPTQDADPALVVESRVLGPHHLIRAGLWPEAALLP